MDRVVITGRPFDINVPKEYSECCSIGSDFLLVENANTYDEAWGQKEVITNMHQLKACLDMLEKVISSAFTGGAPAVVVGYKVFVHPARQTFDINHKHL